MPDLLTPSLLFELTGAFAGKTVAIVGADTSVGSAAARMFAKAGARLALIGADTAALENLARELEKSGHPAAAGIVSATSEPESAEVMIAGVRPGRGTAIGKALKAVVAQSGPLDALVNTSSWSLGGEPEPLGEKTGRGLEQAVNAYVESAVHPMREALVLMQAEGAGSLVNLVSAAGCANAAGSSTATGNDVARHAGHAAIIALTSSARAQVQNSGVHVGLVVAGSLGGYSPPDSWLAAALAASVYFRLTELSVPAGAATLARLTALVPKPLSSLLAALQTAPEKAGRPAAKPGATAERGGPGKKRARPTGGKTGDIGTAGLEDSGLEHTGIEDAGSEDSGPEIAGPDDTGREDAAAPGRENGEELSGNAEAVREAAARAAQLSRSL